MKGHSRLSFDFYQALRAEIERYETHFKQLQRDFAREMSGETLTFAVDFSELFSYLHPTSLPDDTDRARVNTYIIDKSHDQLTLLPGAIGELLDDLEEMVPQYLIPNYGEVLYTHPAVANFKTQFPTAIHDIERLSEIYSSAETILRSGLGGILDVIAPGGDNTPIENLRNLLKAGKIAPVEGIQHVGAYLSEITEPKKQVESYLNVYRPSKAVSNAIDAVDFSFAFLLNKKRELTNQRYMTIYSQSVAFIEACRSKEDLRWDNDYLIRDARYLRYRTQIQQMFNIVSEQSDYVMRGHTLCLRLKQSITGLSDIYEQIEKGSIIPSLELIDLYREFDENYRQPLAFEGQICKADIEPRAKALYEKLLEREIFEGAVEEAYDVLKEHLRVIHQDLQTFAPKELDITDISGYKKQLWHWLQINMSDTSSDSEEGS